MHNNVILSTYRRGHYWASKRCSLATRVQRFLGINVLWGAKVEIHLPSLNAQRDRNHIIWACVYIFNSGPWPRGIWPLALKGRPSMYMDSLVCIRPYKQLLFSFVASCFSPSSSGVPARGRGDQLPMWKLDWVCQKGHGFPWPSSAHSLPHTCGLEAHKSLPSL